MAGVNAAAAAGQRQHCGQTRVKAELGSTRTALLHHVGHAGEDAHNVGVRQALLHCHLQRGLHDAPLLLRNDHHLVHVQHGSSSHKCKWS